MLSVALILEILFQYLFDYRIRLAVLYLLDSDMAINNIGIKLGYDYQSHFCTDFNRKYGVSPIKYRAMQHAKDAKHEDVKRGRKGKKCYSVSAFG